MLYHCNATVKEYNAQREKLLRNPAFPFAKNLEATVSLLGMCVRLAIGVCAKMCVRLCKI